MDYDQDKVDEITLALLWLTSFKDPAGVRAWKGQDWNTMERLHAKGFISDPRSKTKSVRLSEEGEKRSRELFAKYFALNQPVWYNAVIGYDLVTGWGSPNGQSLIDALAGPVVSGFWLSTLPGDVPVAQDSTGTAAIAVTDAGGFSGNVSLTAAELPSGVTASFNPSTTASSSVLTLTASSSATVGTAAITITGTAGSLSSKTSLFVIVNPPTLQPSPVNAFGSTNIGSTGSPSAVTLTFVTAGTLATIGVLTQGVRNLDFTNAGGGTCSIGTAYAANASCTVDVSFTPRFAAARYGAVELEDANGNALAKVYLQGAGVGPQATFNPGTQSSIGSGFIYPEAAATLGDGSIYVTDYGNGNGTSALYLEKFSNGTYTQSKVNCTFITPAGGWR